MQTTIKQLRQQTNDLVKIGATDLDGVLRCKYLHRDKVLSAMEKGLGFCNVIFGWDIADVVYENKKPQKDTKRVSFPDAKATIIPDSYRTIPWENNTPFLLADFANEKSFVGKVCPRQLLAQVCQKAEQMGFAARFGPEYEWFTYRESPTTLAEKNYLDLQPITPGMFGYSGLRTSQNAPFFHNLFQQLADFRVNLEGLHTETGPGVLEAAILHQPALEAADRAILFKQSVKEVSYRHGWVASFMAKPSVSLPGCGGHLHQSLWRGGKNLFYDEQRPNAISQLFEHYLAGQLTVLPVLMPMLAPTVNSYKRYVAGSWAATHFNWGVDNRTTALRVIRGYDSKSTRLETRIPGADANPYLAIAACLAAGLYGIEHQLPLPDAAVTGSAYSEITGVPLPLDLHEATRHMQASELPAMLFGPTFTEHFIQTRQWEWQQYQQAVTDWEIKRYFELT
ncbi:MAG: glutamine synthetase [Bacteroidota bacterium]